MTKLPVVKAADCIRALQRAGFVIDRQKGSHVTLIRDSEDMPHARTTPLSPITTNHSNPARCARLSKMLD